MDTTRTFGRVSAGLVALAAVFLAPATATRAAPLYQIATLGLADPEHTRDDGYRYTAVQQFTQSGLAAGYSNRYDGGPTCLGRTAWLYDGTATVRLGFADTEHTRDDGYRASSVLHLTESGLVAGDTSRFNGGATFLGQTAWLYDGTTTIRLGFTGDEYTRDDGYRSSSPQRLTESGLVAGYSDRFAGSQSMGRTVWLYDGTTTREIGLSDPEHTRADGLRYSELRLATESGLLAGYSNRYNGGTEYLGRTVWLYDGTTTRVIGLTGPGYTRDDGYRASFLRHITESGFVVGDSNRYDQHTDLGRAAWLYDGTTTTEVGLDDYEHTASNGYRYSMAEELTETGLVIGYSKRYNHGAAAIGQSAWLYDGTSTVRLGFTGSGYTRLDGYGYSKATDVTESGFVIGYSARYRSHTYTCLGQTAWLYNGTATRRIGLIDSEHIRADGYSYSWPLHLTESGLVTGYSERYSGSQDMGLTAWVYDGITTRPIGLTDPEHTRSDGYRVSTPQWLTESGLVTGHSDRYAGSQCMGRTVWLYDGTTTRPIGLADPIHTRNDGYRYSHISRITESGFVGGFSIRYNGGPTELGHTAWVYDPLADTTVAFIGSVRSDGYAFSEVLYLGDDGLALGYYEWFAPDDTDLGNRAFAWTPSAGFTALDLMVAGGLEANGWEQLYNAYKANATGQILGYGKRLDQTSGQMAYLLTPTATTIPEPGTVALLALGMVALGRRGRRPPIRR